MKTILRILILLLIVLVLIVIIGLFLPKNAKIESSLKIQAPIDLIYDQVNTLKNWEAWSPWSNNDSTMRLTYDGSESGVGATYSWISDNSGNGSMTITDSKPYEYIRIELDFGEDGIAKSSWTFKEIGDSVKVTWTMISENMSFVERYFMLLFNKQLIEQFDQGLEKINEICQKLKYDRIGQIQEVDVPERFMLIITDSSRMDMMEQKMIEMFNQLSEYITVNDFKISGYPTTIIHEFDPNGNSRYTVGLPIDKKVRGRGKIKFKIVEATSAVMVEHWGRIESTLPHEAIYEYTRDKGLTVSDDPWTEYLTNPQAEPDMTKWHKLIYYPI